ncbi:MAG: hypothetical protein JXQ80_03375 [Bacteroidales bacterium]|nr:hypothetical protein [Bacteroidales bacterium]
MKRLISLVSITLVFIVTSQAQYVGDAIRYSQNFPTLTARSMSMGGAFTSLGGDLSSAYLNPAGLGLYRKSEFVFSPGLGYNKTNATYQGREGEDFKYQFIMSNTGYVGTYNSSRDKGLVSASYAIAYNRLNNFNNMTYMRGDNNQTSLVDNFMTGIDGVDPEYLDAFTSRLAFDAYIIDTVPGSAFEYQTPVLLPVDQRRKIDTRGGTGEYSFSFGLNFSNVWYVGMGLGIYQLRYEQTMTHTEYDIAASEYDNFHYTEKLDVEGSGVSFKMGTMVRLFNVVRIGASLHLPTYYRIDENYMNSMYSEFDNGFIPSDDNGRIYAEGSFKYKLQTPLKLLGGASVQIGKIGLFAVDVEYVDYSGMRLRERDEYVDFDGDNQEIKDAYRSVLNIKAGGELRFDNLSVRVGGGYYPSPFSSWELNKDASYGEITAGLGYRTNHFFFDFGLSTLLHKEKYYLYSAYDFNNPSEMVDHISDLNQHKFRFIASMGFRF